MTETWKASSQYLPQPEPGVYAQIAAVYGRPFADLKAPEGHQFVILDGEPQGKVPVDGDVYLSIPDMDASTEGATGCVAPSIAGGWRLILSPIPEPKPREYVIRLRETGEVRWAQNGEWIALWGTDPTRWTAGTETKDKHPILRVVSREAVKP